MKRILALGLMVLLMLAGLPTVLAQQGNDANAPAVDLQLVADGFAHPLGIIPAGDDSGRLFIWDQTGQIWIVDKNGNLLDKPFLDLTDRMVKLSPDYDERGLLGLAFHPNYAHNGRFFVYYSAPLAADAPSDWNATSHISEFSVSSDNPNVADPNSEQVLLAVNEPEMNHDGGQIAFGPDGYLYIPLGDGGAANDVGVGHNADIGNAQDTSTLLGSILRIDVDSGDPYGIPSDNPFANGNQGQPEIFAYGFRNPYRMSFDSGGDHQLFVGDAGQNSWEEVDIATLGNNYGWNIMEGTHCFDPQNPNTSPATCANTGPLGEQLTPPIIEYKNANQPGGLGLVVVGGNVYRGSAFPEWDGHYVFGDWSTSFQKPDGTLLIASPPANKGGTWSFDKVSIPSHDNGKLNSYLLSFGHDADQELYVLTTDEAGPTGDTGAVYKIVPVGQAQPSQNGQSTGATVSPTGTMTTTAPMTTTEATTPSLETNGMAAQGVLTPSVTVQDQSIDNGTVTVAEVDSDGPGWIVIHADDNGSPGQVIGHAAVQDGQNMDVVVDIDTNAATELMYAMLHTDAGTVGTYEFPGPDAPVQVNGETVVQGFAVTNLSTMTQPTVTVTVEPTTTMAVEPTATTTATAPMTAAEQMTTTGEMTVTPSVTVQDQAIENGTVTVAEVDSDGPGWIVIHADNNGSPGDVIGHAAVSDGQNMDVVVDIDPNMATPTLYAMLHTDAGTVGTYEFPGADAPVQVNGQTVVQSFAVTNLAAATQPTMTATVQPSPTVAAQAAVTGTVQPSTLPVTGGATPPWVPIALVGGGLIVLLGAVWLLQWRQAQDVNVKK